MDNKPNIHNLGLRLNPDNVGLVEADIDDFDFIRFVTDNSGIIEFNIGYHELVQSDTRGL